MESNSKQVEIDLVKELIMLDNDKKASEGIMEGHKNSIESMLLGGMGKDMEDVLSGKKVIKIKKEGFFKKLMRKFDHILEKF